MAASSEVGRIASGGRRMASGEWKRQRVGKRQGLDVSSVSCKNGSLIREGLAHRAERGKLGGEMNIAERCG